MTKIEFLSELENAFEGKLNADDLREIIEDYRDIFDCGLSEGKSEEIIYQEIGSPAKIARKILDDMPANTARDKISFSGYEGIIKEKNFAPLSRRFAAFVVDNVVGSILLTVLLLLVFVPFSSSRIVTQTEGVYSSDNRGYEVKLYQNEKGISTRMEVSNSEGKRLFKGNREEFADFLDKNNIRYPEDFKKRMYITELKDPMFTRFAVLSAISYIGIFIFFGIGNIFNVIILWKFNGYTLGKRLFKLKTVKVDGTKLKFSDAVIRELVIKIIGNIITGGLLNIGSFIWACITDGQKTVHDASAKTKVIELKG